MKKLLLLTTIFAFVALSASAQLKLKSKVVNNATFKKKAQSALKASKGKQQGLKAVKEGEECTAFVTTKTDDKGTSYKLAKDLVVISNDGATGIAFNMFNFPYEGKQLVELKGIVFGSGSVCIDKSTTVTITFDDESQVTLRNFEKDNCDGIIDLYIGELVKNADIAVALKTKKIKAVKVSGVERTVARSLSEGNQQQIQGTMQCFTL